MTALLRDRFPKLDQVLSQVVTDLLVRWQKADGSFRARELMIGWDNVPMHRWAQSQIFRSLCFLLSQDLGTSQTGSTYDMRQPLESNAIN
jgi:hypothetical protein